MKINHCFVLRLICAIAALSAPAISAMAEDQVEEKAAIEKAIQSYVDGFNARDAKVLASHWSPEGVYTSRLDGQQIVGRDELEKEFTALFKEEAKTRLAVVTESIDFVSPNVAVEQGVATVVRADASPEQSAYSVVYIKRDEKWLIDRVSEEEPTIKSEHYENLKGLEWMIGQWEDRDGEYTIATNCKWTRNQNFIVRSFTASNQETIDLTGMQIVGWDAAKKQIRSWVFDSSGGVAEATWTLSGKRWIVKTTATMPDGSKGSSTTIIRPVDANSFGWQKVDRNVAGELLPNIDEVIIVRVEQE